MRVVLLVAGVTAAGSAPRSPALRPVPPAGPAAAGLPRSALPPGSSTPAALAAADRAGSPPGAHRSAFTRMVGRVRVAAGPVRLPPTLDLRWDAPAAGDQGSADSCVAWAVDYTLLGWLAAKEAVAGAPFAPMYAYSQLRLPGGGSRTAEVLALTVSQGAAPGSRYWQGDGDSVDRPGPREHAAAAAGRIRGFEEVFTGPGHGADTRRAVETALVVHGPVVLDIPIDVAFEDLTAAAYSYAGPSGPADGMHDVVVFAYDPAGVWVENSWGSTWGYDGWAHLSWEFVTTRAVNGFAVVGGFTHRPARPPTTDPDLADTAPLGSGSGWTPPGPG